MNTKKIEIFSNTLRDKLRTEIISKANQLGISENNIAEVKEYEDSLIINGQVFGKEIKNQRNEFKEELTKKSYNELIDEITYTWFNRFVALKFIEENNYLPIKIFTSSNEGQLEPDLLTNCLDINFMNIDKKVIYALKNEDDDEKLYKYLIISLCNHLHKIMPFLFEKIKDYTELMFPDKLLRTDSILNDINNIIQKEDWKEVEVIGWIYQDYINPRKDKVFSDLKDNIKISKENIPAATQLFTPKWIVKYLVENSVARLWLESNPNKELQNNFKYFIEQEYETPKDKTKSPEEITVLDPAMGSGHMLVYAFEVLYHIYKSQGYLESEISEHILNKNLYGLEIDNRASQLAGFALLMKARSYDKNLFEKNINLNLVAIQETPQECPIDPKKYSELNKLWTFFYDAKNYGSILNVEGFNFKKIEEEYESFIKSYSLSAHFDKELLKSIIKQAKIMSNKYDVVVTNPPYMGLQGMNKELDIYVKKEYPDTKYDLFSVFIEKCIGMTKNNRYTSMITMQSWMFLSSFEKLRNNILNNCYLDTMVHLGTRAFDQIGGEVVSTTAFVIKKIKASNNSVSTFVKLNKYNLSDLKHKEFFNKSNQIKLEIKLLMNIPGMPISYWISDTIRNLFSKHGHLDDYAEPRGGLSTNDNSKFLRNWNEVSLNNCNFYAVSLEDAQKSKKRWFPLNKGGGNKKWYGLRDILVDYEDDGMRLKELATHLYKSYSRTLKNIPFYFKKQIGWTALSSVMSARYYEDGFVFGAGGSGAFPKDEELIYFLSFFNSKIFIDLLRIINPSLNLNSGDIRKLPIVFPSDNSIREKIEMLTRECIEISKNEWDSRENSWDFKINELIKHKDETNRLDFAYKNYCKYWETKFYKLHSNEEELNQLFIDIYDLNDELNNKVSLEEVTILKEESEIKDNKLVFKKEIIIKQFLSYVVGCIFGRYNPEKEGLILANQGQTIKDFNIHSKFKPDQDNIVPITDNQYFQDDIVAQLITFLKTYFGEKTLTENMDFIASGLKGSGSSEEKIRKYFLKEFYKDHCKNYSKKPIYWMFTSGEQQGFNAIIYMHRYNKELLAKMRVDYLHKLQDKIEAKLSNIKESTKEKETLNKQSQELTKYDEILNNKASQYIEIDLDDGVDKNYKKFDKLTEKI